MAFVRNRPNMVYWLDEKLYLNITNRCSNDCYFCLRQFKAGVRDFNLKLRKEPSLKEVIKELKRVIRKKCWREIVFCGFGEPLARLDCVLEVARGLRRFYGGVVRGDTNGHGYLLNEDRDVAGELTEAGLKVEVTVVRIPEVDVEKVREMVERIEVGFRVREYIPCIW